MNHEPQTISLRAIVAVVILAVITLGVMDWSSKAGAEGVHFSRPCRVVAGEADAHDGKLDRIAARHGGIDYSGSLHGGRWSVNDTGKVFGYSVEEDAIVYATARCAATRPAYRLN